MKINFQEIKKELTAEQVIELVLSLGAETYELRNDSILFPTICHNPKDHDKSMKMYYYFDSCLFKCYTECDETFDIFDLYQRVYSVNGSNISIFQVVDTIANKLNLSIDSFETVLTYKSPLKKREKQNIIYDYPKLNKNFLNFFEYRRMIIWEKEGISKESIEKFNILYYPYRNKIVIPHYDVNDNLIGIRGRNLEESDLKFGKYMPIQVEGKMYSHPLSFNLYGLNINKENIIKNKSVYLFEGEKSVLKFNSFYPDNNNSVAVCGSNFNKFQLMLLKKITGLQEIIICFDKQFENIKEEDKYFNKLYEICEKYSNYCKMSFLFDDKNLTNFKDSPVDQTKEIFENLVINRKNIRRT